MAIDGLLPRAFSRKHRRFHTPYIGLIILCGAAYVASLLGGLSDLINSAVFLLAFAYFATCGSTIFLQRKHPRLSRNLRGKQVVPSVRAAFSVGLILLVRPLEIRICLVRLGGGLRLYVFFSPRHQLLDLQEAYLSA